ncbi:hypothetical protein ART_0421 [Arthrobacter sp. PAMC 25486]|uniref:hypothetical protein n=1 Tax=Arthrobacter sp. PAMC 25486 TaxID=1494608 RepID=UPI000536358B|nr:hypothetical protein [Arthrobacter sp. PAMC 25486]AIY00020.1 hypothetical protein ART_0421 [Arthrobacter sp. PAMC 25486]
MGRFCRTITTAVLGLVLVGGLGGCTPHTQPPLPTASQSPESVLDASCPILPPDTVKAERIPQGTPAESIASVLNSYSSWVNAGTDVLRGWADTADTVADACVEGLAEQGRIAYAQTIFTTHTDVAWQDYYAGQQELTAQTLRNAVAANNDGQGVQGRFELLKEISSSATVNGTFLKFDAIYRPAPGTPADPTDWAGLAKPTRWYVELVPFDGFFIINYIEQKPAVGY